MRLPLYIAGRYLFARKSHNVINIISAISAAGMAVGTAALILILSVYNGFDGIIRDNLSDIDPDVLVKGASGKYFDASQSIFDEMAADERVKRLYEVVEDNVFLKYGDQQGIARAKGVPVEYAEESGLADHITEGQLKLIYGETPMASVGTGLAYKMGIHPRFVTALDIYYPEREGKVSIANAMSSLNSETAYPSSLFSVNANIDAELLILPISTMKKLTGADLEATGIEIMLRDPAKARQFISDWKAKAGDRFELLDRYEQHPSLYKMMKYEKAAVFLILLFVVIIIAFNIFGSLSMLVIEKENDIETLRAMGANNRLVRRIFVFEGWMITLVGLAVGLIIGLAMALLQQRFGFVKMPGNFLVSSYPVVVKFWDVAATVGAVAVIGLVIAEGACILSKSFNFTNFAREK